MLSIAGFGWYLFDCLVIKSTLNDDFAVIKSTLSDCFAVIDIIAIFFLIDHVSTF